MHKYKPNKKTISEPLAKGFTLIELIVVIAIIGLLASVVMTSLGVSRSRAEISKVLTEHRSVASALELYRQANNGNYPGVVDEAISVGDLITNNGLSEYIKQTPSVSPLVATDATMYYILNSKEIGNSVSWCGDQKTVQDYILYFYSTTGAEAAGLFKTVYSGVLGNTDNPSIMDGVLCVPVNQE